MHEGQQGDKRRVTRQKIVYVGGKDIHKCQEASILLDTLSWVVKTVMSSPGLLGYRAHVKHVMWVIQLKTNQLMNIHLLKY